MQIVGLTHEKGGRCCGIEVFDQTSLRTNAIGSGRNAAGSDTSTMTCIKLASSLNGPLPGLINSGRCYSDLSEKMFIGWDCI